MNSSVQKYLASKINHELLEEPDKFAITLARSRGHIKGWDRGPEKLYLTLERDDPKKSWGFSCHGGADLEHWGGLMSGNKDNFLCMSLGALFTRCCCEET